MSDYGTEGLLRRRQEREQGLRDQVKALTAELDAVRGELGSVGAMLSQTNQAFGRLEAERDALAAQVAALSTHAVHHGDCSMDDWKWGEQAFCSCGLFQLLANLPAAAAEYVAARRVAEAFDEWERSGEDDSYFLDLDNAHKEWRKAANRG